MFGCGGTVLAREEAALFAAIQPAGFILFARNCETPDQVRALTAALRDAAGQPDALVLIDQEGGRVARLRPPHWRLPPAAGAFGRGWRRDPVRAMAAAEANASLMGLDLIALGIDVDCAPVLDLGLPETTAAIGDRAFAADPAIIAALGRAVVDGLLAAGVLPVIKHIPGHGRATVDSHEALPMVSAPLDLLERTDFVPFKLLADLPWAMTGHVLFGAIDPEACITVSARGVQQVIRGHIGFDGLLLSDDLSMQALGGALGERASRALAAGCDVALHCNGRMDEMVEVAARTGPMTAAAGRRFDTGRGVLARHRAPMGRAGLAEASRRLAALLPEWG